MPIYERKVGYPIIHTGTYSQCYNAWHNNDHSSIATPYFTFMSSNGNSKHKKVLLRERKRHTARRVVVSTHSVVLSWLTPPPPAGLT